MTKLVAISDTHSMHSKLTIPECDILIHSGDATMSGSTVELINFLSWYQVQPAKNKIFVAGNHDATCDQDEAMVKEMCAAKNIIYLSDSGTTVEGLKIWGSPITPTFGRWSFMRDRGKQIRRHWSLIPEDTNILITHGAPYSILDSVIGGEHVGCSDLMNKVLQLPKLKAHFFGHLHLNGGKIQEVYNIKFVNASVCDESYKVANLPVVLEL